MHIHRCTFLIVFLKYSYFQCSPKIHPHTNTFIRDPCQLLLYFLYGEMSNTSYLKYQSYDHLNDLSFFFCFKSSFSPKLA